jgi:hypothetical protein
MQKSIPASAVGNEPLSPSEIASREAVYGAPEPPTWSLLGLGFLALGVSRRRM